MLTLYFVYILCGGWRRACLRRTCERLVSERRKRPFNARAIVGSCCTTHQRQLGAGSGHCKVAKCKPVGPKQPSIGGLECCGRSPHSGHSLNHYRKWPLPPFFNRSSCPKCHLVDCYRLLCDHRRHRHLWQCIFPRHLRCLTPRGTVGAHDQSLLTCG